MTPERITQLFFSFESVKCNIEINLKEAQNALLALVTRRNDPSIWAIIEMVCIYPSQNEEEKQNIERTILELLRN